MIRKYVHNPTVVEAMRLTTDNVNEVSEWCKQIAGGSWTDDDFVKLYLEDGEEILVGEWLIKGLDGEFYVSSDEVFQQSYKAEGVLMLSSGAPTAYYEGFGKKSIPISRLESLEEKLESLEEKADFFTHAIMDLIAKNSIEESRKLIEDAEEFLREMDGRLSEIIDRAAPKYDREVKL